MLNCTSAVSGFASNLPSAPTKTVLGCAVTVGRSCARPSVQARTTNETPAIEVFTIFSLKRSMRFIRLRRGYSKERPDGCNLRLRTQIRKGARIWEIRALRRNRLCNDSFALKKRTRVRGTPHNSTQRHLQRMIQTQFQRCSFIQL